MRAVGRDEHEQGMLGAVKFGKFIEAKRLAANISANQLARLLGISSTYLRGMEQGKQPPLLDTENRYEKLAVLLGVNRHELLVLAAREREVLVVPIVTMSDRKLRALMVLAELEDDSVVLERVAKQLAVIAR